MKVTYLGTTMLLLDDGVDQVLLDAHVSRPGMVKAVLGVIDSDPAIVERVARRCGMDRVRAIVASHSHHDHVLDMPAFAQLTDADVYGSLSTLNVARGNGVPEERLRDFADSPRFAVGAFDVRVIPSIHSKPMRLNDNLGEAIEEPLALPAKLAAFKEGGSFDFLITHPQVTMLIRPSFNYLPGQLDGMRADVLLQGVTNIHRANPAMREAFFRETLDKVGAQTFVPLHWDNFFTPLEGPLRNWPFFVGDFNRDLRLLQEECARRGVAFEAPKPFEAIVLGN